MWGNTLIIERLLAPVSANDLRAKEEDKLVLAWEQRRWARGRFTTANGRKIGIALPTGSMLLPDAILWIADNWYLKIEAAAESLLEIFPADYGQAVRISFEIGNRHFPLALCENSLLVPDDKAMARLLDRLGARWERTRKVFDPVGNTQLHQHG